MPTLAVSNRAQLAYKLEGVYPTNFGIPQAAPGVALNMLSESLDANIKNEQSKQIRSDRQVPDLVQVDLNVQGSFSFESQFKEYDPFIEGATQGTWNYFGTLGLSTAYVPTVGIVTAASISTLTASATTATVVADSWATLVKGQWFTIVPAATESAAVQAYFTGRPLRVTLSGAAPNTTVLVLDASTPIDTAKVAALQTGWRLSSASVNNGTVAAPGVMKSYTFEVQHVDNLMYRQYLGCITSKMAVKLSVGAIVTGSFDFVGKSFALGSTALYPTASLVASQVYTPANATKGVFDMYEGGSVVSAITYVKSADIMIDNKLRPQEAVAVFGCAGIAAGTQEVTAKLEIYFAERSLYDKFISGAASSLSIPILDINGNGYIYHFPKIKYTAVKVATGGLDQDLMLSADIQALPDLTPGSVTYGKTVIIYRVGV